jgi:hypothetical protein
MMSTSSSRFFPGGWFSSSPKIPDIGEDTPADEGAAAHETTEGRTKEKKGWGCLVM